MRLGVFLLRAGCHTNSISYQLIAMASKGPRVSVAQRDILIEFIEQHPYLARATTSLSRRLSAARKKELWDEVAAVLNQRGTAVKTPERWRNHWSKLVHAARREAARSAAERTSTGGGKPPAQPQPPPQAQTPPQPTAQPHLQPLPQLQPLLQPQPPSQPPSQPQPSSQPQPRQTPQPRAPQLPRRQLRDLEEVVQRTAEEYVRQGEAANARAQEEARFHQQLVELHRKVQQQRLEEDRLMRSLVERLLLHLMPAAAQGPPPPQ
ncbi:hypothetical protein HPB50_014146 [Hyalomma asiaticum]|uniref:Uncharacterized protein n=1 Tax=Hyalomma asiaticum TaxID=266040 RepID=A0ACB7TIF8_HYAAI|nr:hypothetical protein HPB50_014146 [Hyalomma asiaticum]